jgi:murein DD-endopeptidase MepM/ murein hydrolase activator NlpD
VNVCRRATAVVVALAAVLAPHGSSQAAVDGSGIIGLGAAADHGSLQSLGIRPASAVLGVASDATGNGYWMVAGDGGIFAFGDAPFFGSTGNLVLNRPVVGMAPTHDGGGYWLVASDGGVFAFGNAGFFGSLGAQRLNAPIVAMTPTSTGKGYWLIGGDGGVFAYGDAPFLGSTGGLVPSPSIVSMAPTRTGTGYWLVTASGQVFGFGSAQLFGDLRAATLSNPVIGIAPTPSGKGYWIAQQDGQVWPFGDASTALAEPPRCLTQPIVSLTSRPQGDGLWLATAPLPAVVTAGLAPLDALDAENANIVQRLRLLQGCEPPGNVSSLGLVNPLPGDHLTDGYGPRIHPVFHIPQFHRGIDLAGTNRNIQAAAAGTVVEVGTRVGYGTVTIIDHGGKIATVYAHQSVTKVQVGDKVAAGQVIGTVGSTGYSTGPHLYYELRVNGDTIDPTPLLPGL